MSLFKKLSSVFTYIIIVLVLEPMLAMANPGLDTCKFDGKSYNIIEHCGEIRNGYTCQNSAEPFSGSLSKMAIICEWTKYQDKEGRWGKICSKAATVQCKGFV